MRNVIRICTALYITSSQQYGFPPKNVVVYHVFVSAEKDIDERRRSSNQDS